MRWCDEHCRAAGDGGDVACRPDAGGSAAPPGQSLDRGAWLGGPGSWFGDLSWRNDEMSTMYEEGTGEALATFVDLGATIAALSDLERRHLIAGDVAPVGVITGLVEKGLVFRTKGRWWLTELGGSVREALAAPAVAALRVLGLAPGAAVAAAGLRCRQGRAARVRAGGHEGEVGGKKHVHLHCG